jgi:hypothetical protein
LVATGAIELMGLGEHHLTAIRRMLARVWTLEAMRGPQIGRCAGSPGEIARRFHRSTRS